MTTLAALGLVLVATTAAPESVSTEAALASGCVGCHAGSMALDARDAGALYETLMGWRRAENAALMTRIARGFTPEELRAIADYVAAR